ncbi:EamA domain-containing protein [Desulfonema limicola]|uniref:EamA domain-containing protein n=2 Tax=Desulfonema limicola TaxID=45656 RepID=A0A975B334_9BACT|nr:EamA domain-containing protein [Desulfonema limicola]
MFNKGIYNRPYLLLTFAVFFWSVNFIVGRAVRADVPPIALAFWRWAGASFIISFFAISHVKKDWDLIKKSWLILIFLAAVGIASFNTLAYTGLQLTIAINAFLMQSMMPVMIVMMSFILFQEKIHWFQAAGIIISLAGAMTIIVKGDLTLLSSLSINKGDILIFTAVVSYAGYSVMLRKRPAIHPLSFVFVTFVSGSLMLLPLYLWETFTGRPASFNGTTIMAVIYVMIFPSIISYLCFNRGVELAGANKAGLFLYMMPVFGSIMAIIFLGESFCWFHAAGIGLIGSGIMLATRRNL